MMSKKRTYFRSNKGAVLVELSLTLPILLGIIFFIYEFGNVIYLSNSLNVIARSAARYAAISPNTNTTSLKNIAGASSVFTDLSKLTLNVSPTPGASRQVGDPLTVSVQWSYTPFINPFNLFGSSSSWSPTLSSSAVSRVEIAIWIKEKIVEIEKEL